MAEKVPIYQKNDSLIEKVWKVLIDTARKRTTISQLKLLNRVGLTRKNLDQLLAILQDIGEVENKNGRPLVNCLAVMSSGKPNKGFFFWLSRLSGFSEWHEPLDKLYEKCKSHAFDFWTQHENIIALNKGIHKLT